VYCVYLLNKNIVLSSFCSVKEIDGRLGFFQEYFKLTGAQVRELGKYSLQ